jgi:hypothetical protein
MSLGALELFLEDSISTFYMQAHNKMEGGAAEGFRLGDIGNYTEVADFYPIGIASLFGINLAIASARLGNIGGASLNTYFDTFGLEGVLANAALITIIFQITRWIYTVAYAGSKPWSPFIFICILLAVQFAHDIIFYYGAINVLPSHMNEMIDLLKGYAKHNGATALGGHALLIGVIGGLAMIFKETTIVVRLCIIIGTIYAMPYLIAMARSKPVQEVEKVKEAPKEEEKEREPQKDERSVPQPKAAIIQAPMKREPIAMNELDAFYSPL